jgi:hypothetical protein
VSTGQERRFSGLAEMFELLAADAAGAEGEMREDRENW